MGEPLRFSGSIRPRASGAVVLSQIDDELLILDPRVDRLHLLDRVGAVVWSLLDGEATIDELVDDLSDAFRADPGVVRRDVIQLLGALDELGVLDDSTPPVRVQTRSEAGLTDSDTWRPTYLVDPPAP